MTKTQDRQSMIKDTTVYAVANYIAQGVGIVNSIVLRRFMGPAGMGVWSILQVILGYCGYASFGTTKAMARDYPYLRGKGEHEKADQLKDMTLCFSILMSVIPALIIFGYLFFRWDQILPALRYGLFFIAIFLFIQRFYDLVITLLRSDKKFFALGKLIVWNALGMLAVSFLFVYRWNIYGQLWGTALVTLGCLFYIYRVTPYHFRWFWNGARLWQELKLGVPLVGIAFLMEFLKTLDRWIIANKLGFYEVGLYSMSMMVNTYVYSFPMMFSHVWYPNLLEAYGRSGGHAVEIKQYLLKPVAILSVMIPALCSLAIFWVPELAQWLLPKFMPGIPAMKIYLVGTFFVLLAQFSGNFLVTLDKYWVNIPILAVSIGLNFIMSQIFLKMGLGLSGVAGGTAISFVFYGLSSYFAAMRPFSAVKEILGELAKLAGILALLFGGAFIVDSLVKTPNPMLTPFAKTLIYLIWVAPFFWRLEKKTSVFRHIGETFRKKTTLEDPTEFAGEGVKNSLPE